MKKPKLYVDTSVLGAFFDTEDQKRVDTAQSLIKLIKDKSCEGFISYLTLDEILKAPHDIKEKLKNIIVKGGFKILEEVEECIVLADAYVNDEIIPKKYRNDARHIAIGIYHECDFIVFEKDKIEMVIQVCYKLNHGNLNREINGCEEAMDMFGLSESYLISYGQEDFIQKGEKKIYIIPAWKLMSQ